MGLEKIGPGQRSEFPFWWPAGALTPVEKRNFVLRQWHPMNIFANIPANLSEERTTVLQASHRDTIERVVSAARRARWVLIRLRPARMGGPLKGAAKLELEDKTVQLAPGDSILTPAHALHQMLWTTAEEPIACWRSSTDGDEPAEAERRLTGVVNRYQKTAPQLAAWFEAPSQKR